MPINLNGNTLTPNDIREYEYNAIVQDGLVLNLDGRIFNTISGTTWYDLTGNGNNGTLTNGPTFNSANGGSLVFDGSNDYVLLPNGLKQTSSQTISLCINPSSLSNTTYPGIFGGYGLGVQSAKGGISMMYFPGNSTLYLDFYTSSARIAVPITGISLNTWVNIVAVYDRTTGTGYGYKNGSLINSNSFSSPGDIDWTGSTFLTIGRGLQATTYYYFQGKISHGGIYNRALTASEVLQNYNLIKYRYGL